MLTNELAGQATMYARALVSRWNLTKEDKEDYVQYAMLYVVKRAGMFTPGRCTYKTFTYGNVKYGLMRAHHELAQQVKRAYGMKPPVATDRQPADTTEIHSVQALYKELEQWKKFALTKAKDRGTVQKHKKHMDQILQGVYEGHTTEQVGKMLGITEAATQKVVRAVKQAYIEGNV